MPQRKRGMRRTDLTRAANIIWGPSTFLVPRKKAPTTSAPSTRECDQQPQPPLSRANRNSRDGACIDEIASFNRPHWNMFSAGLRFQERSVGVSAGSIKCAANVTDTSASSLKTHLVSAQHSRSCRGDPCTDDLDCAASPRSEALYCSAARVCRSRKNRFADLPDSAHVLKGPRN